MGVKVMSGCLNWSQTSIPHSSSSPQTLASAICSPSTSPAASSSSSYSYSSSPAAKRRCFNNVALVCRYVNRFDRSAIFGTRLYRSRSCEIPKSKPQSIKRACSASMDAFSDEEFSKKLQELALRFRLPDHDDERDRIEIITTPEDDVSESVVSGSKDLSFAEMEMDSPLEEIIPASIERKANSVDLPMSLRMIKRKKQWQQRFREAGESAYCSVKKAFSSMVFIIRELQSYTLQMREILFYEDLQGILVRVQKEMNASFVWLFQQVFSHTPTLMVYVMILLANYSVYSMSSNAALQPAQANCATVESVLTMEEGRSTLDSSSIKSFSVSPGGGRTTSIGGINGGGGKFRPLTSGTDGDGRFDESSDSHRTIIPNGVSPSSMGTRTGEESVSGQEIQEEDASLWDSIVDEALGMQALVRDENLDLETTLRFVSQVSAQIESEDYSDYFRTELVYQTSLSQEPTNPLLLANYAQFLYIVAHDYDRAEEYFKRATNVEPKDAEALSKYASFLWKARKDLWGAEETYLEAISVDPMNSYYAANYAHFLYSTGAEDTCFPLTASPDTNATNNNL